MSLRTDETNEAEERFAKMFANISADEMRCKCGDCLLPIDDAEFTGFCLELQHLRNVLGFPFRFTSFYRCPTYNDQIYINLAIVADRPPQPGSHMDGPHTKGAADIAVAFERMYKLVAEALQREMGVGAHQRGPVAERYIHVDNLGSRFWTY